MNNRISRHHSIRTLPSIDRMPLWMIAMISLYGALVGVAGYFAYALLSTVAF